MAIAVSKFIRFTQQQITEELFQIFCVHVVSKKVLKLQNLISDANAKQGLRKIQSKCEQTYHKQEIEQKIDFDNAVDWSLCWCSEDD